MDRTKAFISYSHKDELWKDRLMTQLAVLEFEGLLHVWADTRISVGEDWYGRIQSAMDDSRVAVLLVSPDFLASKFIRSEEVPRLLQRHAQDGMLILPLIARPCAWQLVPWLSRVQVRPKNGNPLSKGTDTDIDDNLATFTYEVASLLNRFSTSSTAVETACREIDATYKALETAQIVDDRAVIKVLVSAIQHGVPIYNEGSSADCARIYHHAANRLMELISASKQIGAISAATKGVQEAERLLPTILTAKDTMEDANKLAWQLRKAFDQILDAARASSQGTPLR